MHPALLDAHMAMLPRIQAQETLAASLAVSLGGGKLKQHDATRIRRELVRDAEAGRRRRRGRPATAEQLAAAGVGVRVTRKAPEGDG